MLVRTRQIAFSCNGGPCPQVHETTIPGVYTVQGDKPEMTTHTDWIAVPGMYPSPSELTMMAEAIEIPAHETVLLVLRETLDTYMQAGTMRAARDWEDTVLVPAAILTQAQGALV
jgi:hypothetical protein